MKTYNEYTNNELLDKIKNTKSFASTIKAIIKYDIENKINELVNHNFIGCSLIEKLYSIKLGLIEYPKCKVCNNPAKLKSLGWSDYCNNTCGYFNRWKNLSDEERTILSDKLSSVYHNKSIKEKSDIKEKRKHTLNEAYGVNHNFKIDEVIKNRQKTWKDKYGYDNPNKSIIVKEKLIETNNLKYGHNSPLQNTEILKKAKETLMTNYNVNHNMKSDIVKQGFVNTCLTKYGETHFMKNSEMFDKISKTCYKQKEIIVNNILYKVQGYENIAIRYLIDNGKSEDQFIINNKDIEHYVGKIYWTYNNKNHRYYPDFYLKDEHILFEVKSEYTYNTAKKDGSLDMKINACIALNIPLHILIFNKNLQLIKYEKN
jgi:hypothetical protein